MFGGCPRAFGYLASPVASAIFASDLTCHMLRRHVRTGKTHRLVDGKGCCGTIFSENDLEEIAEGQNMSWCKKCEQAPHPAGKTKARL